MIASTAPEALGELVPRGEDWKLDGECNRLSTQEADRMLFPPTKPARHAMSLIEKMCGSCPIQQQCLEYGKNNTLAPSMWGGQWVTPRTRKGYTDPVNLMRRRQRWEQGWQDFRIAEEEGVAASTIAEWRKANNLDPNRVRVNGVFVNRQGNRICQRGHLWSIYAIRSSAAGGDVLVCGACQGVEEAA